MSKKSIYDPYTDWILEHYQDYRNCPELVKALRDKFGLNKANVSSIKYWFDKRFGMTTVYGRHDFSEEEKEFIKKYYPDNGPEKTAEMLTELGIQKIVFKIFISQVANIIFHIFIYNKIKSKSWVN